MITGNETNMGTQIHGATAGIGSVVSCGEDEETLSWWRDREIGQDLKRADREKESETPEQSVLA